MEMESGEITEGTTCANRVVSSVLMTLQSCAHSSECALSILLLGYYEIFSP